MECDCVVGVTTVRFVNVDGGVRVEGSLVVDAMCVLESGTVSVFFWYFCDRAEDGSVDCVVFWGCA